MVIEQSNGQWGSRIVIFQTNSNKPSKLAIKMWFLDRLVENIDSMPILDELVKTVENGELSSADADVIISKAYAKRKQVLYDNITRLLAGKTSNMEYNYGSGEYEQKPPLGWGQ